MGKHKYSWITLEQDQRNIHKLHRHTIRQRVLKGLSVEEALSTAVRKSNPHSADSLMQDARNIHQLDSSTIRYRLNSGMTEDECLSTPKKYRQTGTGAWTLVRSPKNIHGLSQNAIEKRLQRGLSPEEALALPRASQSIEVAIEQFREAELHEALKQEGEVN